MSVHELVMEIPDAWWMSSNHRYNWRLKAARTKWLRQAAALEARQQRLARGLPAPVTVVAHITYPSGRRVDPNNASPVTKALIDGLTDYGAWPDDDQDHVIGPDHRYAGVTKGRRTIRLVITTRED